MTQGERVKKVRKTRQLTLEKFGEKNRFEKEHYECYRNWS